MMLSVKPLFSFHLWPLNTRHGSEATNHSVPDGRKGKWYLQLPLTTHHLATSCHFWLYATSHTPRTPAIADGASSALNQACRLQAHYLQTWPVTCSCVMSEVEYLDCIFSWRKRGMPQEAPVEGAAWATAAATQPALVLADWESVGKEEGRNANKNIIAEIVTIWF